MSVGSIALSPQAVSLPNPPTRSGHGTAERIPVSLKLFDTGGRAITQGKLAQPVKLTVYGPSSGVLTAETPTISSATSAVYFDYSGGFVANSIIVSAVSGRHAFALMTFQPKHRGFPGTSSVTFPMPNTSQNMAQGWLFTVSAGGGPPFQMQMDTGSRGMVVPVSELGPRAIGPGPAGYVYYVSSGGHVTGNYYLTPVTLSINGKQVTTVPIEVLATPEKGEMGVGFGRGGLHLLPPGAQPVANANPLTIPPELNNPFLALTNVIQGAMHPGYIIRANSVTLGITQANQAGYGKIKLTPGGTGPGDWSTEPGCFAFPMIARYPTQCGTVHIDTGIPFGILKLPISQRPSPIPNSNNPNGKLRNGVRINIAAPNTTCPVFSYAFTTGDGGPMTPEPYVKWSLPNEPSGPPNQPAANVGRRPISGYDYLFDDGAGYVGFKPLGQRPPCR